MIEAYKINRDMRETYYRMNGIKHAEVWDTESGYQVALCGSDGCGWPTSPEFHTIGQCAQWASTYCPELTLKG